MTIFPAWTKKLLTNEKGYAKPILANAMIVLEEAPELAGCLAFNELRWEVVITGALPWCPSGAVAAWREYDTLRLTEWLQLNHLYVNSRIAGEAVQAVAAEHPMHPVRDYLNGLAWDGRPRLDQWVSDYLGCPEVPYSCAVGSKWMIGAVARAFEPGCKMDCVLVLEGRQGILKSSAIAVLGAPWHTDEIAALGTKDAAEQTIGVWIIELAELDAVTRAADVAHVKAFISRGTDRFRRAYGRHVEEHPRQCVFAATSNNGQWNHDSTGGRRFWPIACGKIEIDGLTEVRDQLWAEARDRYRTGEAWWLADPHLVAEAEAEVAERGIEDPLEEAVCNQLRGLLDISTGEIMDNLSFPKDRQTTAQAKRIGTILRSQGWVRRRLRSGQGRLVSGAYRFYRE